MANCCNNCGCNNGTCGCNYHVTVEVGTGTEYSSTNINLTGVGVYDSQSGTEFNFRGIASANNSLGVSLDNTNHTVLLTLDVDLLINDLPQATTTQRGVGETATNAEAIAKASTTVFLTPSNLAAIPSSTTLAGLVELATDAEAIAGASTTLAITPANLAAVSATYLQTTVFTDSVARAATVPTFEGQFGTQLDTDQPYVTSGPGAGDWNPLFTFNLQNEVNGNTSMDMNGFGLTLIGNGTFTLSVVTFAHDGADASFNNGTVRFGSTGPTNIDYDTQTILNLAGTAIPAASVLSTAGLGVPSSKLIADFISNSNTQTGYTTFTNPSTLRTCNTATVTLQQLAQLVGTLIEDLKAVKLPAT